MAVDVCELVRGWSTTPAKKGGGNWASLLEERALGRPQCGPPVVKGVL